MGSDGPKPSAAQAAAVGRIELGPVAARSAAGPLTQTCGSAPPPPREAEGRDQSTTGFWPPSMDKVTPVM